MPQPLRLLTRALGHSSRTTTLPSFLVPFVHQPRQAIRSVSILSSLSDVRSAYQKRIRRGRGPASGKGKTAGRGHKGQKAHGKVPAGFNGGQTPDHVVAGRRGFTNKYALDMAKINLDKLQDWIDQGRLDSTKPITLLELHESNCTHGIKDGVKLLGRNASKLHSAVNITVSRASASAIAAVEAAGGTIQTRYYTRPAIKRILNREMHPTISFLSASLQDSTAIESEVDEANQTGTAIVPKAARGSPQPGYRYRLPDPAGREDLEYYRDPAHRGYLSHQLTGGEGPSLFFRTPFQKLRTDAKSKERKESKTSAQVDTPLW